MKSEIESLFVWRPYSREIDLDNNTLLEKRELHPEYDLIRLGEIELFTGEYPALDVKQLYNIRCIYCDTIIVCIESRNDDLQPYLSFKFCPACGWGQEATSSSIEDWSLYEPSKYDSVSTESEPRERKQKIREHLIRDFDINSSQLSFEELGKYLSKNFKSTASLTSRKFEELIGDVYKNEGYTVELTQATHDKGKDLILLNNGKEDAIVEIKKWKGHVGVKPIRELRGVQLTYGHRRAMLVTNSRFSKAAKSEANSPNAIHEGYEMELVGAEKVLRMLDAYKHNKSLIDELKIRKKTK